MQSADYLNFHDLCTAPRARRLNNIRPAADLQVYTRSFRAAGPEAGYEVSPEDRRCAPTSLGAYYRRSRKDIY